MAAAKLVLEHQHKRTIDDDISRLKGLMPWIGGAAIDKLHMATLQPWMADRRGAGCAAGTVNNGLQIVRRILNLAASEWMDEHGLTWIQAPAKIKLIANPDRRQPHPLNWDEQMRLLAELPNHLIEATERVVERNGQRPELVVLRVKWERTHAKLTQTTVASQAKNA